jgi:hypothetical protein
MQFKLILVVHQNSGRDILFVILTCRFDYFSHFGYFNQESAENCLLVWHSSFDFKLSITYGVYSIGLYLLGPGNLLRSGDIRGFQSMARMYTRLAAMPKKG